MDLELLKELGLADTASLRAIEYMQRSLVVYRQTLQTMGLLIPETIGQAVDNSQLVYRNPPEIGDQYADISEAY